jgi:hypothetical protein
MQKSTAETSWSSSRTISTTGCSAENPDYDHPVEVKRLAFFYTPPPIMHFHT